MSGYECPCGMAPSALPWLEWDRLHAALHLTAIPDTDQRTRDNLHQLCKWETP